MILAFSGGESEENEYEKPVCLSTMWNNVCKVGGAVLELWKMEFSGGTNAGARGEWEVGAF